MILKKISLINFRNYDKTELELANNLNVFVGDNAQGKTNILEGIYVLALTKSHRVLVDSNVIKHGKSNCKIIGTILKKDNEKKLEVSINIKNKIVKINNRKIKKLVNYISNLKVIMFCPDDLEIVKGSPGTRRNYVNIELGQISKKYLTKLNEYNKILRMRNEYLRLISTKNIDKTYYEIITENLIERAIKIYLMRKEYIENINLFIEKIFRKIAGNGKLYLKYDSFVKLDETNEEKLKEELKNRFNNIYEKEIQQGVTLIGPHRDDILFVLDEKDLKLYGSQGQQRAAVLSLKMAEIDVFYKYTDDYPMLLLDDIFSELDNKKVSNILKYLNDKYQIIITTTDIRNLKKKLLAKAKIFKINNGKIEIIHEVK